jgi:elongator complex protein 4
MFAGSPPLQSIFPAYSGFLHIHRLPTPNSLLPPSAKLSVLRGLAPGSNSTSSGAGGMDNNLGFKLKRRRGLVIETLHLEEGGGTNERRTTPAPAVSEEIKATSMTTSHTNTAPSLAHSNAHSHAAPSIEQTTATKPAKKMERRKIRFDDDPNENPSGILGAKTTEKPAMASSKPKSALRTDRPDLYEF